MDITQDALKAAGFVETRYDHDDGVFYVRRLPAKDVPYACDHLIDDDLVEADDEVIVEITPDHLVQMVILVSDYVVGPVPVGSDEGPDLLRGLGLGV